MNVFFTVNINRDPNHEDFMSQNTRDSFKDACRRWNCKYVEWTKSVPYHPAVAKLKAFNLLESIEIYPDKLFIIDSDTIIRSDTPNPFELFGNGIFAAVRNQQDRYPDGYKDANVNMARNNIELVIKTKKLSSQIDINWLSHNFFNSGVILIGERYRSILDFAFNLTNDVQGLEWWDQIPLNIATYIMLGNYTKMCQEWNYQFPQDLNRMSAYIYHFAGNPERYEILKHVNWKY